ncbi:MAG: PhzF family phenazine biosynthesis protein [bacterium]|nr:PhzF family phenazine biosynthesis protein [bacterium]
MSYALYTVDAFAAKPFSGNPAAVCLLPEAAPADWMQSVANEIHLSETAFLVPGDDSFGLRWFTPKIEVDLCGHATLASAHVLWETGTVPAADSLLFATRSGLLGAEQNGEWIRLDFPGDPPHECEPPSGFEQALGGRVSWFGRGKDYEFVEVATEAELRGLRPDFRALKELVPVGVCVTALPDSGPYDFMSRFFAPGAGIDEDPVTGSAHCSLAPYWSERTGKSKLLGYQASARGGTVRVSLVGDRVAIEGQALTVTRGELL